MTAATVSLLMLVIVWFGGTQGQEFPAPDRPSTGTRLYLQPDESVNNNNNDETVVDSFTVLAAGLFSATDGNILWCQSANNGSTIGEWYLPDGTRVSTVDEDDSPLHVYHTEGQVALVRDLGIGGKEGLYRCVIPDENGINQTLWVGAYRTNPYKDGDGTYNLLVKNPMIFSLSSSDSLDSDPPVFTLSFNVTGYPPSNVVCEVNGNDLRGIDIGREVITSPYPSQVLVTVTVTTRQSGTYNCTAHAVAQDGLLQPQTAALTMNTTGGLDITVTDAPVNVTGTRTGISQAILSWSPPVSNTPVVQGYIVYYDSLSDGTRLNVDVGINTTLTLNTLDPEVGYSVFVVAYGGDLPSNASNTVSISEVVSLSTNGPTDDITLEYGEESVLITCTVTVNVEVVSSFTLAWFGYTIVTNISESFSNDDGSGNEMMMAPSDMMTVSQYSINLTLNNALARDAGLYSCGVSLTDNIGGGYNDTRDHAVFVQIPNATNISVNIIPGTSVNRTFISGQQTLLCTAKAPVVDIPVDVSFTWYGPNGSIIEGDKYQTEIVSIGDGMNNNTYTGLLNISNLETSDNLTMYFCQVEVGVDPQSPPMNYTNFTIPSVARSEPATIIVEALPFPDVTVTVEGAPIIGRNFTLMCSAVFDESLAVVSYQWLFNGSSSLRDGVSVSSDNTTLTIDNVTTSDQGDYSCTATLRFDELLGAPASTSGIDTYQFFTLGDPEVQITATGSTVAGSMYSLTCNVMVISGTPTISWFDPYGNEVEDINVLTLENTDRVHMLTLEFPSLDYNDVGDYTCMANLSVPEADFIGTGSDEYTINIQIPTPNVSISNGPSTVRGTESSITCMISLNSPLPMEYNVTLDWYKDGVTFDDSSSSTVTEGSVEVNGITHTSTIAFNPLNTTDTGDYECRGRVTIAQDVDNILNSNETNATQRFDVDAIPDANVTLSPSGTGVAGDPYSLTCVVIVGNDNLSGFNNNLTLSKMADNGYEVLTYSIINTTLSVDFSSLTTSDGGIYKCSYTTGNDVINYQRTFEDTHTTTVSIPSPNVSVTTDPVNVTTPLIEHTYIDLVCNVSVSNGVNTDITVDIGWTRNGVTIVDGSDGYSIMMVNYISTLHIEELTIGDNNTVYTCNASVIPSISTFIIGSNGSDSLTTTVREFESSDLTVSISFNPSLPTAGNILNITCTIDVPRRLVYNPTSVVITDDNGFQNQVAESNPDATETGIQNGTDSFYKVVTINPVKTSDGKRFYCQAAFGNPLDVTQNGNRDLSVYIPSPTMSIGMSPDGIIYESTRLVITCNATLPSTVDTDVSATVTWTGPNGGIVNNNRISYSQATSIGNNVYQSQVTFNPVDNGDSADGTNDGGDYTCEMIISSDDNLILTSMNNITDSVTVTDLPDLQVSISTIGSTTVGNSLNITCTVVLVKEIVGTIDVTWDKTDDVSELEDLNLSQEKVIEGAVINKTLIMDPIQFNYRGMYMCIVMYNFTYTADQDSASVIETLTVDFPPFDVSLSQDYTDPLYSGTPLTITCNTTLSSLVDIPVIVTTTWTRGGTSITENTITDNMNSVTNLHHTTTLDFYPLNYQTDDGTYQCLFNIVPGNGVEYVTNTSNSSSTELNVLGGPPQSAVDIIVNVSSTSAIIQFTIPWVSGHPEHYYIQYNGLDLQNQLTNSTMITSSITNGPHTYDITLTGLEEANMYEFNIVSSNSFGQSTTPTNVFTTKSAAPSGEVLDCRNTTFYSRNITLSWDPPLKELHNGVIIGYQIECNDTSITLNSPMTTYTVESLTPFTSYVCLISAINNVGVGPSGICQYFTTDQEAPSDSPQNFTADSTQFQITFSWSPPNVPNGIITQYLLIVSVVSISDGNTVVTTSYEVDGTHQSHTLTGYRPYQEYSATISARTIMGYGPEAHVTGRTLPDISSSIILYTISIKEIQTIPSVNSTTLNITWWTPLSPNGLITHYNINVTHKQTLTTIMTKSFTVNTVDGSDQYTLLVTNLSGGVPYYITIGAVNEVGVGEITSAIAFTTAIVNRYLVPTNITALRSDNGSVLMVQWNTLTLEDVGGFYKYNIILSTNDQENVRYSKQVAYTESLVILNGLNPSSGYVLTMNIIIVDNGDGQEIEGPMSNELDLPTPNRLDNDTPPSSSNNDSLVITIPIIVVLAIILLIWCSVYTVLVLRRRRKSKQSVTLQRQSHKQSDYIEMNPSLAYGTVITNLSPGAAATTTSVYDDVPQNYEIPNSIATQNHCKGQEEVHCEDEMDYEYISTDPL